MKVLKNNDKTETTKSTDTFISTETLKQNSKNVQMASDSQVGQQQNMEIIQVISFIEESIQKLKTLQSTARFSSDPVGPIVNLSNKHLLKTLSNF